MNLQSQENQTSLVSIDAISSKTSTDPKRSFRNSIRRVCRQDGGALVEFALIAPLMLCLLTGIFGLGFALCFYLQLNNAVDVGARTVAVIRATNSDGTTPDPCAAAYTAITNAAPTLDKTKIKLSFNLNGTPYNNVTSCNGGAANIIAGKTAQVSATYPYTLVIYGWQPTGLSMSAQTTELLQ